MRGTKGGGGGVGSGGRSRDGGLGFDLYSPCVADTAMARCASLRSTAVRNLDPPHSLSRRLPHTIRSAGAFLPDHRKRGNKPTGPFSPRLFFSLRP